MASCAPVRTRESPSIAHGDVSGDVQFPSAESLFDGAPRPPDSFIVETSIDAGAEYIEVDFDNAGSATFAPWVQNTYVFGFAADALLTVTGAAADRSVSNLAILDENVFFGGSAPRRGV
jgi:hypothetical protein